MRAPVMLLVVACGPVVAGPAEPLDTFLAFPSDFSGYTRWEAHALESTEVLGEVHSTGQRTLYLSRRPAAGSSEFPVGTMIVKALPGVGRVFARVKRGGGYNPDQLAAGATIAGALNWEWFELQHVSAQDVMFVWRGVGPPSGEGYGGDPNGCNSCHSTSKANDFVSAPDLKLSDL